MEPPGLLLGDRYQLAECIAMGGMGEVWRATDLVLGRPVAVKLLRSGCAGSEEERARFRAEARHAGSLSHPGIARVYDYREANPPYPPYLVMELVDGPSLARLLDEGPVDPARTMGLIAQAAAALQAAHAAGLVHRDIKPGNMLVGRDGDVKVTDFGIAHAAGSASATCPGLLTGTPAYLAPERAAGAPATPATDIYALGIVAYQCLTGRPPFEGEPLAVALAHIEQPVPPLPPRVPAGVVALVADLTAKDPWARPASAGEVADRADQLRDALTRRASSLPALEASGAGKPNRRVLTGLNALLVLAMTAAIVAAGWVIAGGLGPDSVLPSAAQRQHPAGSHLTHRGAPARRTGGATTVAHQSGPAGPQPPVSGPSQASPPGQTPEGNPEPSVIPSSSGAPATTGTPSPTGSPPQTGTPTPTGSPPQTGTPTPTGSPSQTGTPTPTGSPPQTGTPTPTGSPPQTGTPTPTGSPTQTGTPTPTGSPAQTGTPTPTGSPPRTATPIPTSGPPQTATTTPTGSPAQTATITPTGSPAQTGTPPPTGSPAQTGTPTTVLLAAA
jgi:eukaryotic-like serine/threonine-protein kinase